MHSVIKIMIALPLLQNYVGLYQNALSIGQCDKQWWHAGSKKCMPHGSFSIPNLAKLVIFVDVTSLKCISSATLATGCHKVACG